MRISRLKSCRDDEGGGEDVADPVPPVAYLECERVVRGDEGVRGDGGVRCPGGVVAHWVVPRGVVPVCLGVERGVTRGVTCDAARGVTRGVARGVVRFDACGDDLRDSAQDETTAAAAGAVACLVGLGGC